ncbi:hypothetical protein EGR_10745 [Echinococcus granulosus]|uniref:Uncharacterized protein n=1 Tax=Echinococcus granulosus TaxID=6210 RepID=W6U7Q2_ECHGR|nr:hypothetical protein EGR_10745 [Echinococcus granulosus]EUB54402.1 hypothetical protein EGR_10745 [Echinococcus granulosus]
MEAGLVTDICSAHHTITSTARMRGCMCAGSCIPYSLTLSVATSAFVKRLDFSTLVLLLVNTLNGYGDDALLHSSTYQLKELLFLLHLPTTPLPGSSYCLRLSDPQK